MAKPARVVLSQAARPEFLACRDLHQATYLFSVITRRRLNPKKRDSGTLQRRRNKLVAAPTAGSVMGAVIEFNRDLGLGRFPVAQNKINVVARDHVPKAIIPCPLATGYEVGQPNLDENEAAPSDCALERPKERSLPLR